MKLTRIMMWLSIAGQVLTTAAVQAADEDAFLEQLRPASEQTMGLGQTALWTLPLVATQYQPAQPTPVMQQAAQAQDEGRFLDALILLDDAGKAGPASAELDLLRASFLLQDNQPQQALDKLSALQASPQYAADAYALTAMAYLHQGQMQPALEAAQQARAAGSDALSHLALSYALQSAGHLEQARAAMRDFNTRTPQAIPLAREAELALTLGQTQAAEALLRRAQAMDAAHPYVLAVDGLADLIQGETAEARDEFTKVLKRDPKDAKALLGMGLAEIKLGNIQAGQKRLQAANEAEPGNALILTYLGRSQQQTGQGSEALASWRRAQQADPRDPAPWLYQAQAELQANHLQQAQDSLREAQARLANRSVYRGAQLLQEDEQLLQANLAETQRRLGLDNLALHTLSDTVGEQSAANLRNQADLLQGQRFGESARRSLLLQSLFNAQPGSLPAEQDIYGDGAGQTGASVPQHGAISGLNAQQASFNNYDALFTPRTQLEADVSGGSRNTHGEQIRLATGSDTLGLSVAGMQFRTDGFAPFDNLDNREAQAIAQWRPFQSTQAFMSYQTFNSKHGEISCPADPISCAVNHQYDEGSILTRLGLRQELNGNSEWRGLLSYQHTHQTDNWQWTSDFLPLADGGTTPQQDTSFGIDHNTSTASGLELQYRRHGSDYAAQLGLSSVHAPLNVPRSFSGAILTNVAQQAYVDWQQTLNSQWQVQAGLVWGKNDKLYAPGSTHLQRWLPRLGAVYTPDSATHVRLAAWKHLDDAAVGNAALAPVTLAGITLNRPNDIYKLMRGVALGADKQLNTDWLLEGLAQRRWTEEPYFAGEQGMLLSGLDESRLVLHWQPADRALNLILAYDDEYVWRDPIVHTPDSVQQQHLRSLQLGSRWQAVPQCTVKLEWSHNLLTAIQQSSDTSFNHILLDVRDSFNQTDASLSWQLKRMGSLDLGVRNATGRSSQYVEIDPLVPRFNNGRLWYGKLKLLW
ncbi:MAG: TonB-dependent receptor [Nitrosomonadales bacterium]|nr:TonB-dependent receptor [Nitrosomonadales bacterium]